MATQTPNWSVFLTFQMRDEGDVFVIEDSGCQELLGYRTEISKADGSCTVTLDLEPKHLNRHGIFHGGFVATLLDVVSGNTASQFFDPVNHAHLVTLSLNLNYVAAVSSGRVTAKAKATGGGKSIAYVTAELFGEDNRLLATSSGVFKRMRK